MRHFHYVWASLLSFGLISPVFADDSINNSESPITEGLETSSTQQIKSAQHPRLEALKELKNVTAKDLKVNANATQPESQKDPLQPLNRTTQNVII